MKRTLWYLASVFVILSLSACSSAGAGGGADGNGGGGAGSGGDGGGGDGGGGGAGGGVERNWESLVRVDGQRFADKFGTVAAMSENYAVVAAPFFDNSGNNGDNRGAVYVFRRTGPDTWDEGTRLMAPNPSVGQQFGFAAAISDDYVVVGIGNSANAAFVFRRTGDNSWTFDDLLEGAMQGSDLGRSVAISGNYIVVGAPSVPVLGVLEIGAARVYYRSGSSGSNPWGNGVELVAPAGDRDAYDQFGHSVAISGDHILVGAWRDDNTAGGSTQTDSGAMYAFRRGAGSNTWDYVSTYKWPTRVNEFGTAIAMSEQYAVVGTRDAGAVVFRRSGDTWTQETILTVPNMVSGDKVGSAVAISGERVIVGAPGRALDGRSAGTAIVFSRNGGTWGPGVEIAPEDGADGDAFGSSVAIAGDYAFVGAEGSGARGPSTGAAYAWMYR